MKSSVDELVDVPRALQGKTVFLQVESGHIEEVAAVKPRFALGIQGRAKTFLLSLVSCRIRFTLKYQ